MKVMIKDRVLQNCIDAYPSMSKVLRTTPYFEAEDRGRTLYERRMITILFPSDPLNSLNPGVMSLFLDQVDVIETEIETEYKKRLLQIL
jgi:hypothetical protein